MRVGGAVAGAGREEKLNVATGVVRSCQCGLCGSGIEHRDVEYHRQMNLLLSRLDEQQRRWYLGVESQRLGDARTDAIACCSRSLGSMRRRFGGDEKSWPPHSPSSRPIVFASQVAAAHP